MNLRVSVLCEYLARVEGGEEAEADGALLRSIDGLVQQLPLVLASLEGGGRGSSSSSSSDDADSPHGRTPLPEGGNFNCSVICSTEGAQKKRFCCDSIFSCNRRLRESFSVVALKKFFNFVEKHIAP
jgi:hypothetical protein